MGTGASPDVTEKSPFPSESQAEQKEEDENTESEQATPKKKNKKKNKKGKGKQPEQEGELPEEEGEEQQQKPGDGLKLDTVDVQEDKRPDQEVNLSEDIDLDGAGEETPIQTMPQKSPLLTSHRLSSASSLDEVVLTNSKEDGPIDINDAQSKPLSPPVPSKDETSTSPGSGLMGLSGALPSLPWGPPPVNKNPPPPPPPAAPPMVRKPSGPFAWFSRSSTGAKEVKSPPQTRRDTSTSVSTIASNLELADGDASSVSSKKPRRNSLKDQFKLLRMREDTTWAEHEEAVTSGPPSITHSGQSPPIIPEEQETPILAPPTPASPVATSPGADPSTINPNLAPGTVSGFARSASDASTPVDWELWQQLVNNGPQALAKSEELNSAIKRGIPQTIRGVIWQILADCHAGELESIYRDLVARGTDKERRPSHGQINGIIEESTSSSRSSIRSDHSGSGTQSTSMAASPSQETDPEKLAKEQAQESARIKKASLETGALQKLEKAIRRDLGSRTSYSKYFVSQGSQESLFGLCKAYALYDEAVGYAQGMNFIIMPLLFNMDEIEAFELLVKLMNKYGLREMFINDMPGLHRSLYQFERLLEDLEPALYVHLRRRGVPPQLYATQWFLTLFAYRFPLQLVLRIYDLIFEEGLEITILKFAIAIMRRNAEALLSMKDMSPLTTFLKERVFDAYIDKQPSATSILESGFFGSSGAADKEIYRADILVQDACDVPLTQDMIKVYSAEWEEKSRAQAERELELENLRHTVTIQASRVRLLEERAEASDKEHVQLASELVHVKVENQELRDLNDALTMQVGELKNVVDKQPGEIEEKLRVEMERIMKRNIEVQNENRASEDAMAEMEKELVATKMKWAEVRNNNPFPIQSPLP